MVDEEVDVGKIPGGLDEIARVVVVGHGAQRQPLVDAEATHTGLARLLQHGIRELLVVEEPAVIESLRRRPRVRLPGVDLERRGLLVHEVEIGLAELRRDEAVGEHPARLRHAIDLVADVRHLLRRDNRFLRVWPGRRRDEPDRRLAVEEDFLDQILPGEVGHGAAIGLELRVQPARAPAEPEERSLRDRTLAARLGIGRVVARADVMQLHVEDEDRRAAPLLERRRVGRFDWQHVEEPAEDRVHREKRGRHAAASAQELSAAQPEARRQARGLGEDPILHLALRGRLRDRRELFVGHESRRQRHGAAQSLAHARADAKAVAILNSHAGLIAGSSSSA